MITRLSARLADAFIISGAAKEDDRDVYVYGLDVLLSTVLNLLCMVALGILVGRAMDALIFLLFFTVLRSAAGGYHADTHFRCFLIMLGAFGAAMALLFLIPAAVGLWLAPAVIALSAAVVVALAPAPHENRPVSPVEFAKFRRNSLWIAALEGAAVLLCIAEHAGTVALAGAFGMLASAASLCASFVSDKFKKREA